MSSNVTSRSDASDAPRGALVAEPRRPTFYFDRFEDRVPPEPVPHSVARQVLWQLLITLTLGLGAGYLWWRWTASLNYDALWFAIPLVVAETCSFIGLVLYAFNLWSVNDPPILPPPARIGECSNEPDDPARPLCVDIMFTTYSEEPELVRLGIRDAKRISYPHPIDIRVHVLDDGRRKAMRAICEDEGVNYITRDTNEGFKAGNLRNAMENTSGDFLVICDADTRPFPTILERTLGYFRNPQVAWVQTPQWFFDLPEGRTLTETMSDKFGAFGRGIGSFIERLVGPIRFGEDPFVNDPRMFYDVILRRRNWANAAFCCGAGSIHRREAVMEAALRSFSSQVERSIVDTTSELRRVSRTSEISPDLLEAIRAEAVGASVLSPYKFHVSEDIFTSMVLHSDRERGWKSVMHPYIESKMLSPQDLLSWTIQRFKYAGGSLDILFNNSSLLRRGLTWPQRLMYASTFWSYLAGVWNLVFICAPVIYLLTSIGPVTAYSSDFFARLLPFLICLQLAKMVGTWGIPGGRSEASYLAFFPINLRAIWTVLRGKKISFPVTPKERQAGRYLYLVWPHIAVIVITGSAILFGTACYVAGIGGFTIGGILTNSFWGLNNILSMMVMVRAAFWQPDDGEAAP